MVAVIVHHRRGLAKYTGPFQRTVGTGPAVGSLNDFNPMAFTFSAPPRADTYLASFAQRSHNRQVMNLYGSVIPSVIQTGHDSIRWNIIDNLK